MKFNYIASEPNGRLEKGEIEARDSSGVLDFIASKGWKPVSIKAISVPSKMSFKGVFSQKINLEDKVFLAKYLSLMLRVGTDLFKAIDILISDFDKPAVKQVLIEIKDAISKGQPFYSTFAKYPNYFSGVFVNLLKAGEVSGNLDKVFDDLSKNLEREQAIRSKVKSAMIYPIILVAVAFLIIFILVTFALPKLSQVFLSSGNFTPPLFSRIVFGVGLFINNNLAVVLPLVIGITVGPIIFFIKTIPGQRLFSRMINKTPIIGTVLYRIAIQRFASTFSSLLKSGMPIIAALETTGDAVGSPELKAAIYRISRDGITKGLTIGDAFQRETYFPRVVVNLIAISEKAGHIETILDTLADFYESEIDNSIKTLLAVLEPILLAFIGIVVGTIALAMIIPIYQLTGQI